MDPKIETILNLLLSRALQAFIEAQVAPRYVYEQQREHMNGSMNYFTYIRDLCTNIDKAIISITNILRPDDPRRREATTYKRPKDSYVQGVLPIISEGTRAIAMNGRLVDLHLQDQNSPTNALVGADLMAMVSQQESLQRKISEALFLTVYLAEKDSDEEFTACLIYHKLYQRRNYRDELQKLYGSSSRILDIYVYNEEKAYDKLKPNRKEDKPFWKEEIFKQVEIVFPLLKEHERFAAGHYLDFRRRSGSVHASTFPERPYTVSFDEIEVQFLYTALLARDLFVRCARLFPIILPETVNLTDTELNKVFENYFLNRFRPDLKVGDTVEVFHFDREFQGIVDEIKEGEHKGLSFRISSSETTGWADRNAFHPACYVRKVLTN